MDIGLAHIAAIAFGVAFVKGINVLLHGRYRLTFGVWPFPLSSSVEHELLKVGSQPVRRQRHPPAMCVPQLARVAVLRDSMNPVGTGMFGAIRATGSSLGVDVSPIEVRNADEIEHDIAAFAQTANGGLVVPGAAIEGRRSRDLIIGLATKHKLP